jgi:hypothetical protein
MTTVVIPNLKEIVMKKMKDVNLLIKTEGKSLPKSSYIDSISPLDGGKIILGSTRTGKSKLISKLKFLIVDEHQHYIDKNK